MVTVSHEGEMLSSEELASGAKMTIKFPLHESMQSFYVALGERA